MNPTPISKIGVFDSGLGGLTVLKELLASPSQRSYVYFGDTAHVPYGDRQADEVVALVSDIARHLVGQGCQGLVLACNTSSALALSALRTAVKVPILGVIEAASHEAVRISEDQKIAVLANPLTAKSNVYGKRISLENQLQTMRQEPHVLELGCPDLVPIVEEGRVHSREAREVMEGYARQIQDFGADTVVLGCTHYPLLLPVLGQLLPGCEIVNPATLLPHCLGDWLEPGQGLSGEKVRFEVSGCPSGFEQGAASFLGREVRAHRVCLNGAVS